MERFSLKQVQQQFLRALSGNVSPIGLFTDSTHFSIYQNSYYFTAQSVLKMDFEKTARVLGANEFSNLVRRYQTHYPSRSWTLGLLGEHFSAFLRIDRIRRRVPFIAALAEWEWAITTASQAATPSPLKVREDVFKKSIRLSPAAHILKLQWNVHRSVAPKRIKTYLAVVRNQVCVETLELQPQEHRLLESIKNPVSTESFLNFVAKQTTATKLKKWITRWSQNNLIQFE